MAKTGSRSVTKMARSRLAVEGTSSVWAADVRPVAERPVDHAVVYRGRLDVNHHVHELREPRHQPILGFVRLAVRELERRLGGQPQVQVEEDMVGRSARPDLLAALLCSK